VKQFLEERNGSLSDMTEIAEWIEYNLEDCDLKKQACYMLQAEAEFSEMLDELGFEFG